MIRKGINIGLDGVASVMNEQVMVVKNDDLTNEDSVCCVDNKLA